MKNDKDRLQKAVDLLGYYNGCDTDRLERRIAETIRRRENQRRRHILTASCAAVVLLGLFAGGMKLYLDRSAVSDDTIRIVSDNVSLLMPDGSQIILDSSTQNNIFAVQGRAEIVHRGNSLVYNRQVELPQGMEEAYVTVKIPRGNMFDMVLEDGTRIWLNANSSLRFPTAFGDSSRRVHLEGEAYFEVSPDLRRPFSVESATQVVTVTGTSFNVSAYDEDFSARTTLVSGRVIVSAAGVEAGLELFPGQQAVLDAGQTRFRLEEVDTDRYISWKERVIDLHGNTLEQIMHKLARWYDIEFSFLDDAVRNITMNGSIPVQNDINNIFFLMESTGRVKFETEGKKVRITQQ